MNILLLIVQVVLMYIIILLSYKKYNVKGLYIVLIPLIILLNFLIYKEIELKNIVLGIDLVIISSIFIINNIVLQKKGKDESNRFICLVILILSLSYIMLTLSSFQISSQINFNSNLSYNNIFSISKLKFISFNGALLLSLIINNRVYYFFRREYNMIWISNLISIIVSQIIFSIVYLYIINYGKYDFITVSFMVLLRTLIISLISALYTRIIYITCK